MGLPVCGILTGVSYVSGLDYYGKINELFGKHVGKRHLMPPNPDMVLVSVDCDAYALMLTQGRHEDVCDHLAAGVARLVAAGVDFVALASNTAHISIPTLSTRFPQLRILHIADCTALAIRTAGEHVHPSRTGNATPRYSATSSRPFAMAWHGPRIHSFSNRLDMVLDREECAALTAQAYTALVFSALNQRCVRTTSSRGGAIG